MNVHWTTTAEGHLDSIFAYIANDSPEYARRMVDRITNRSKQIATFPLSGRRVPEYDIGQIREVIEYPYRIIYHIKPDRIDILAVIHGARNVFSERTDYSNKTNSADAENGAADLSRVGMHGKY